MLTLRGRIWKDGRFFVAEIPILDAVTQGRTKREALAMAVDWIRTMADNRRLRIEAVARGANRFEVETDDVRAMIPLLLKRARERSGHSLARIARELKAHSRNAYARYERGDSVPTVEKFFELWHAARPGSRLVLEEC